MTSPDTVTGRAARGVVWQLGARGVYIVLSVVAQIALGWLLSSGDFGVYALAIAASVLFQNIQDGGVGLLLVQKGRAAFDQLEGVALRVTVVISVAAAALVVALAPLVAGAYDVPEVRDVMLVIALAMPLRAYAVVAYARLLVDLRFAAGAGIEAVAAVIRYGGIVALAAAGFGPMSFVLPLFAVHAFESAAGWWVTRMGAGRGSGTTARALLRETVWPTVGMVLTTMFAFVDYLALGVGAPVAVVGVYYFAYQLSRQPLVLLNMSLRRVLVPTLVELRDEAGTDRRAAAGVLGVITLLATPVFLVGTVVADPVEQLVWRGRWDAAVPVIELLAAAMPFLLILGFLDSVLQSHGKFRLWAAALGLRGAGLAVAALVAGMAVGDDPRAVAVIVVGYLVASSIPQIAYFLPVAGIEARRGMAMLARHYAAYLAAALVAMGAAATVRSAGALPALAAGLATYAALVGGLLAWPLRGDRRAVAPILRHVSPRRLLGRTAAAGGPA